MHAISSFDFWIEIAFAGNFDDAPIDKQDATPSNLYINQS